MLLLTSTAAHGRALLCQFDASHETVVALSAWLLKHVNGKKPQSLVDVCQRLPVSNPQQISHAVHL